MLFNKKNILENKEREKFPEKMEEVHAKRSPSLPDTHDSKEGDTPTDWLNNIFMESVRLKASDIHIIPEKNYVSVRFRVNGTMQEVSRLGIEYHETIISRIKILAGLQVVEKNIPQDGRLEMVFGQAEKEEALENGTTTISVNFRVSTMPTINGEVAVLRALNKEGELLKIGEIGLSEKAFPVMMKLMQRGHGVILMTGHSGSGKTSALYSVLNEVNVPEKVVVTLEDPVEYRLDGVEQSQVNPLVNYDFAVGLKSILRQDPDVIMIGEIRDDETAAIALRLALVGRLVLSTLHTDSITGAITRMVDMKIPKSVIAAAFTGILSERLVRKICPNCKVEAQLPIDLMKMFHIEWPSEVKTFTGAGCVECRDTGFQGRTGIFEIFEIDDAFREMIVSGESITALGEYVKSHVVQAMLDDGFEKVRQGITSLKEVIRAVI